MKFYDGLCISSPCASRNGGCEEVSRDIEREVADAHVVSHSGSAFVCASVRASCGLVVRRRAAQYRVSLSRGVKPQRPAVSAV